MSTADKLNRLVQTKSNIRDAIIAKGVGVDSSTPFSQYPSKISQISGGGGGGDTYEFQPDPEWWDIKTILEQDTRNYVGKAIILYSNSEDTFKLSVGTGLHVDMATSDGSFYTSVNREFTHTWDKSKDKIVSYDVGDDTPKFGTRYLILYFDSDSINYDEFTGYAKNSIYALFKCNLTKSNTASVTGAFFNSNRTLEYFDFMGDYKFIFQPNSSADSFCYQMASLKSIPNKIDTSGATLFNNFCYSCYALRNLPENLDTSNGTNFNGFCYSCYTLEKLPENLDTSNGTNFTNFCYYCYNLEKLPDGVDTSKSTNMSNFCSNCYRLRRIPNSVSISKATSINGFCYNCFSLESLPDNLTIKSGVLTATNFCNSCYTLRKVPNTLDFSGCTNVNAVFQNCYSLLELPDVLNVSVATNITNLISSCYSLTKANVILPNRGTLNISQCRNISIESLEFIATNAPQVGSGFTGKVQLGSDNINRVGGTSGTIISTLTSKGWTVT